MAAMTDWLAEQFGLAGKTALVTGARSGIGRAAALALAAAGADLILWGRRPADLREVAAAVRESSGASVAMVGADLEDLAAVEQQAQAVIAERRVDILINSAGTIYRAPVLDTGQTAWRQVLTVNLDAVFALTRVVAAPMVQAGSGRVINIASLLSFQGGLNVSAYSASKHAVAGLTKAMAVEWAGAGVNVNAIAPGYVVSDNTAALREDPERMRQISERIPVGRWAQPQDLAGAVVFLASPAAAYIHGHVLVVDGGWLAR